MKENYSREAQFIIARIARAETAGYAPVTRANVCLPGARPPLRGKYFKALDELCEAGAVKVEKRLNPRNTHANYIHLLDKTLYERHTQLTGAPVRIEIPEQRVWLLTSHKPTPVRLELDVGEFTRMARKGDFLHTLTATATGVFLVYPKWQGLDVVRTDKLEGVPYRAGKDKVSDDE